MSYAITKVITQGVVMLKHPRYGPQMWTLGRKRGTPIACAVCAGSIVSGNDAWRPMTNGYNRMERICVHCMVALSLMKA